MAHSHDFTNTFVQVGEIKKRAEGGPYSSIKDGDDTYYFPPNCGIEEYIENGQAEMFVFKLFTQIAKNIPAQIHNFCAPPIPPEKEAMMWRGDWGCGYGVYIDKDTKKLFFIKSDNHYLIPLVYHNDLTNKIELGIMYRFQDVEILNEWNDRLAKYLETKPKYNALQVAIEARPIRNSMEPYDYSPLVVPVISKPC